MQELKRAALQDLRWFLKQSKSRSETTTQIQQPASQLPDAEYKNVQVDFYSDVYAFRSVAQLKSYWDGETSVQPLF
ncbi:MAG: hypothetical protein IT422_12980 [Pirellulaceae bacterium]|nr:hypothetical protein [Pirellulaceae bacterium]